MLEFDKIYTEKSFNGILHMKLSYLMDRMKQLFKFREDILEYLYKIHEREVIYQLNLFNIDNPKWNEKDCNEYKVWIRHWRRIL